MGLESLLADPEFLNLPLHKRLAVRRRFFEEVVMKDPDFNLLGKDRQLNIQDEFLGIQEEANRELERAQTGLERYQTAVRTGAAGSPKGIPLASIEEKVGRPLIKGGLAGSTFGASTALGFGPTEERLPIKPLTSKIAEEAGRFGGFAFSFGGPVGIAATPIAKAIVPGAGRAAQAFVRPAVQAAIEGTLFGGTEAVISGKDVEGIIQRAGIDAVSFAGLRLALGFPFDLSKYITLGKEGIRKTLAEELEQGSSPLAKEVVGMLDSGRTDRAQELIEQQILKQADIPRVKGLLASKIDPAQALEEAIATKESKVLEGLGITPEKRLAQKMISTLEDIRTPTKETRGIPTPRIEIERRAQLTREGDQALANKFKNTLVGEPSPTGILIEEQLTRQADQETIATALGITREQLIERRIRALLEGSTPGEIAEMESKEALAALSRGFQPFQITEFERKLRDLTQVIESERVFTGQVSPQPKTLNIYLLEAIRRERLQAEAAFNQIFPPVNAQTIYSNRAFVSQADYPILLENIAKREQAEEGIARAVKARIESETVSPRGTAGPTSEELQKAIPLQSIESFRTLPTKLKKTPTAFPSLPEREERARQAGEAIAAKFRGDLQKERVANQAFESPKSKAVLEEMGVRGTPDPPHVKNAVSKTIKQIDSQVISNDVLPPTFEELKQLDDLLDKTFGRTGSPPPGKILTGKDLNKYIDYVHTPPYLADINPLFRPFYERARQMLEEGAAKGYDISRILLPLDGLEESSLQKIHRVLIEGTLPETNKVYTSEELVKGVETYIFKTGVRLGRERVKFTPEEMAGYQAVRNALRLGRELTEEEIRISAYHGALQRGMAEAEARGFAEAKVQEITADWSDAYFPLTRQGDRSIVLRNVDQLSGKPLGEVVGSIPAKSDNEVKEILAYLKEDIEFGEPIKKGLISVEVKHHDAHYKSLVGSLDPLTLHVLIRAGGDLKGLKGTPLVEFAEHVQDIISAGYMTMGFRQRFLRKKGIPGFETENLSNVLNNYFKSLIGFTTVTKAKRDFGAMLQNSLEQLKPFPNLLDYIKDYIQYATSRTPEASRVRGGLFYWYLGLGVKSAFVNSLQGLQTASATVGFKEVLKAMNDVGLRKGRNILKLPQGEREMLGVLQRNGRLNPEFSRMLAGDTTGDRGTVLRILSSLFDFAEQFSRYGNALSGYRFAVRRGLSHENAILFANKFVDETSFVYDKIARPQIARGSVKATVFTFRLFTLNMLETYARLIRAHNYAGLGKALAALVGLGGIFAIPGFETIKEVLNALGHDPEGEIRELAKRYGRGGRTAALAFMKGALAPLGIDISRSVMISDSFPTEAVVNLIPSESAGQQILVDLADVAGPIGGVARNTIQGAINMYKALQVGDNLQLAAGVETMLPPAVQAPVRQARRLATGVETTRKGDILTEFPVEVETPPAAVREFIEKFAPFMSFSATSLTEAQGVERSRIILKRRIAAETSRANEKAAMLYRTDKEAYYNFIRDIKRKNLTRPLEERVFLDPASIKANIRKQDEGLFRRQKIKATPRKQRRKVQELLEEDKL